MKKTKIAALLVLTGCGIYTQSAHAQGPGSGVYSAGDVLIGFRSNVTSITTDYLIDAGQAIVSTPAGTTVTLGNFSGDLSQMDASWATDGKIQWGVAGNTIPGNTANTLYAGLAETSASHTLATAVPASYHGLTPNAQGSIGGSFDTVGVSFTNFSNDSGLTANGDSGNFNYPLVGVELQTAPPVGSASWFGQVNQSAGVGFGQYSGFEGVISSSSFGDKIDLFKITPGVTTPTYEGTFNIASTGVLTYTQASAVPEPSALAALAGGAGLLGLIRRRRAVIA